MFFQNVQLNLIGTYCNLQGVPYGSVKNTAYLTCVFLSKYVVITFVLKLLLKNKNQFNFIVILLLVDVLLMDGVGLFLYFFNDIFSGFKFFLAGGQVYLLSRQLYLPLWTFSLLNFIIGTLLLVFSLKKYGRYTFGEMAKHFAFLILGVGLIILLLEAMIFFYL